jgi:hypothetical protein
MPTVGPRVEFDPEHYPRIRIWDGERDHYVYLHRLTAYAQYEIESLWEPVHVHHKDHDGWNNSPENLEALTPDEHEKYHPGVSHL